MTESAPTRSFHPGRFVPALVPALIAALLAFLGHPGRAAVLASFALLVVVLIAAGVPVQRYVARLAHGIAQAVGWALSLAVGMVLVGAGSVLRLVGVDPLTPRALRGNGWQQAAPRQRLDRLSSSPFGLEGVHHDDSPSTGRLLTRAGLHAVGIVSLVLLVDAGVGTVWTRLGPQADPPGIVDAVNFTGNLQTSHDPRASSLAMSEYPWADAYFREIQQTPYSYWPFTESRPESFRGEFVTIDGWERRSYRSADAGADAPVVWMFGGSTTWGEGQRDEHTIASELVRRSEAEGTPIVVRNFGQRGWTHFQEMILFEQLLAAEPAPDVALFYDGANEINTQSLSVKGVPTHTMVDQYAELISGGIPEEFRIEDPIESPASMLWDAYVDASAIRQSASWLRSWVDPPAGAAESGSGDPEDPTGRDGPLYERTPEDARRAVDVYERGRDLTRFLATEANVRPLFLWQPVVGGTPEAIASRLMTEPTVDISDALTGHERVYIDGGHTNEEGARLVADRIWPELEPLLPRGGA